MHITIDKTPAGEFFFQLLGDDNAEKLHCGFYTKQTDCESHALGLQVILELAGKHVTLRKNFAPPGQLVTVSAKLRDSIEKSLAPKLVPHQ